MHTLAVAMALVAALVYLVFLYRDRGLPDAREVAAIMSWLMFALVLLVVVQTMTACPAEQGGVKVFYVISLVVLLINAGMEVTLSQGEKERTKALTWVSVVLSIVVVLVAANRTNSWMCSGRMLGSVRSEYRRIPGEDRIGIAEDLLEVSDVRPRVMKRMLRTLDRAARKSSKRSRSGR